MQQKVDEVNSLEIFDISDPTGIYRFYAYLIGELHLTKVNFQKSSIKVIVKCRTLEILENLWRHYCSGYLNVVAVECLITGKVKEELGMETIELKTTILEEDYLTCKLSLMEIPGIFLLFFNSWNYVIKTIFCFVFVLMSTCANGHTLQLIWGFNH